MAKYDAGLALNEDRQARPFGVAHALLRKCQQRNLQASVARFG